MIQGIDVSHYEEGVDFHALKAGNWPFAFMKCTEGLTLKDGLFKTYWAKAKEAGVIRGAYHFLHPDLDPVGQAEFFLETMGPLEAGDMPPVLDLEVMNNKPSAEVVSAAQLFLHTVTVATKKMPLIYASPGFIRELESPAAFTNYPYWCAEYGVGTPRLPKIWSRWTFWQNSESGEAPGVPGKCDVNYFNGAIDDLKAFCS